MALSVLNEGSVVLKESENLQRKAAGQGEVHRKSARTFPSPAAEYCVGSYTGEVNRKLDSESKPPALLRPYT